MADSKKVIVRFIQSTYDIKMYMDIVITANYGLRSDTYKIRDQSFNANAMQSTVHIQQLLCMVLILPNLCQMNHFKYVP